MKNIQNLNITSHQGVADLDNGVKLRRTKNKIVISSDAVENEEKVDHSCLLSWFVRKVHPFWKIVEQLVVKPTIELT